jgi:hypothetical protein
MMKKISIPILLVIILLGHPISMQGMLNVAVRPNALSLFVNNAAARQKFTSASCAGSLWPKISLYASQVWKFLSNPKVYQIRAGNIQRETPKHVELPQLQSDQEKKKVEKEEQKIDL